MKLYHSAYILPALAAFLAMTTLPVWRGAAARGRGFQSPPNPQGQRCIEPKGVMRTEHMRLLKRWRDEAVREDRRLYVARDGRGWEKSLVKTCLSCHQPATLPITHLPRRSAAEADQPATINHSAAAACDECHQYVNAELDCWNCHLNSATAGMKTVAEVARVRPALSKEEP